MLRGGRVEPFPAPGDGRIRARAVLPRERAVRQQLGVEAVDVHAVEDGQDEPFPVERAVQGAVVARRREKRPRHGAALLPEDAGQLLDVLRRRPSRRPSSRPAKRRPSGAGTVRRLSGRAERRPRRTRRDDARVSALELGALRLGHDLRVVVRELERERRPVPGRRRERRSRTRRSRARRRARSPSRRSSGRRRPRARPTGSARRARGRRGRREKRKRRFS